MNMGNDDYRRFSDGGVFNMLIVVNGAKHRLYLG